MYFPHLEFVSKLCSLAGGVSCSAHDLRRQSQTVVRSVQRRRKIYTLNYDKLIIWSVYFVVKS